ncbi:MAG TPA: hypothetical protein VFA64_03000 [Hyphomicrobiaceae bacterium]|nr:hypothetical protein [Hyphomicrobiaceae bacterium]
MSAPRQLFGRLRRYVVEAAAVCARAWRLLAPLLALAWRAAKPVLGSVLEVVLALVIVFEEWGWRPLAELVGRLARWRPIAAIESVIIRLPPYAALVVFVLPTTLLLPLKLVALVLIANGRVVLAGLLFVAAKVVATALIARLFMLTQPALMQIGWFAWGYETVMPWKDALTARVRASWAWRMGRLAKERVRHLLAAQWVRLRPTVLEVRRALAAAAVAARVRLRQALRDIRLRSGP